VAPTFGPVTCSSKRKTVNNTWWSEFCIRGYSEWLVNSLVAAFYIFYRIIIFIKFNVGVPLVVVPLGHDQLAVATRIVELGIGVHLPRSQLKKLGASVLQVLSNPRFSTKTTLLKTITEAYPKDHLEYLEFIIQTKGATHLIIQQPWYYQMNLDIWLIYWSFILTTMVIIKKCVKIFIGQCRKLTNQLK
jgi:hypothetical protein